MREILFRGKQNEGRWVEGVYFKHDTVKVCFSSDDPKPRHLIVQDGFCDWGFEPPIHCVDVDPKTVGQFTGLTDKNGKKIFEGDILKISKKYDGIGTYYIPPLDYPVKVAVKWDMCAWMWETLCEDKRYIRFPEAWCHFECEVIGNIHDNPELLEVGNERKAD